MLTGSFNGVLLTAAGPCIMNPLPAGSTCTATLALPYYVTPAVPYTIKVVTVDGQIFSYCIRAGDSGTSLSSNDCTQPKIIIEAYDWTAVSGNLVLTIRNVGPVPAQFRDWLIDGQLATATGACSTGGAPAGALNVGSSCVATLSPPGRLSPGVAYVVKVVTSDGAVFSFTAKAGSAA